MAGYIIYSLDWLKFLAMLESPTSSQLTHLANSLVEERANLEDEFDEHDPVLRWPTTIEALTPIVAERLTRDDWYGDLSETGRELWETAFYVACMEPDVLELDFDVESDGVYWNVVKKIVKALGGRPETPGCIAMSRFGTVPFRCPTIFEREPTSNWNPMHSMHAPDEVQRMLSELRQVEPLMQDTKDQDVRDDFFDELLPAIERVAESKRLLFVQVDT